jgi:UDP-N-acetylglucosamine--N-acetylmuramyl-(pentapeptide) pyrophosphoryl-undecaprenol N-acetylglucosamine transferase
MRIVVTGGGSGGHITPLLAVATEIKKQSPDTEIIYIGQKGDRLADIVAKHAAIDETHVIYAGKFRRYHGEGWKQLLDLQTMYLNARDVFRILIGCIQSLIIMKRLRAEKVFIKGGFVGVPVGLAAAFWRIPYITHDSDALAGLANRIIARWAVLHAVALPKEVYSYPPGKTVTVGVPIVAEYQRVTKKLQAQYKQHLKLPKDAQVLTITGGGLGARTINNAMVEAASGLLQAYPKLYIRHFTGHAHAADTKHAYDAAVSAAVRDRVHVFDYSSELYLYTGAADVVVVRAGATNMAEMAAQGKACVIVPNPYLAGGHQLKNAQAYKGKRAVVVVDEIKLKQDAHLLLNAITPLLESADKRDALGAALHTFAYPDSAERLVHLILADTTRSPVHYT